jgi:hypothetical protein
MKAMGKALLSMVGAAVFVYICRWWMHFTLDRNSFGLFVSPLIIVFFAAMTMLFYKLK